MSRNRDQLKSHSNKTGLSIGDRDQYLSSTSIQPVKKLEYKSYGGQEILKDIDDSTA